MSQRHYIKSTCFKHQLLGIHALTKPGHEYTAEGREDCVSFILKLSQKIFSANTSITKETSLSCKNSPLNDNLPKGLRPHLWSVISQNCLNNQSTALIQIFILLNISRKNIY